MFHRHRLLAVIAVVLLVLFQVGCATKIKRPDQPPQPASEPFGEFARAEIKPVQIASKFAGSDANIAAAKKISEHLTAKLPLRLSNFAQVDTFSATEERTLQIR